MSKNRADLDTWIGELSKLKVKLKVALWQSLNSPAPCKCKRCLNSMPMSLLTPSRRALTRRLLRCAPLARALHAARRSPRRKRRRTTRCPCSKRRR